MKALLIVDVQKDFCPGGALATKDGDKVVPVLNRLMDKFDLIIASKDWHPEETVHFKKWPKHCIRSTEGSEFHPDLNIDKIDLVLLKGTGNSDDGYSAFEATNIDLLFFLRKKGVTDLYVTGLATDYCVKHSAIDASKKGINTYVVKDAIKAVNVEPEDGEKALEAMEEAGCSFVASDEV